MKQYKFSMPDELYARIDAAIAKSGRAFSDEIRTRVEASFAQEVVDKTTREFFDRLARLPAEIERELGVKWHRHVEAWIDFRDAILDELAQKQPQEKGPLGPRPHQTTERGSPERGTWAALQLRLDPNYTTSERRRTYELIFRRDQESKREKP